NIQVTIRYKLDTIKTKTIKPFTLDTVRKALDKGLYPRGLFREQAQGIITFIMKLVTVENSKDEIAERSYASTGKDCKNFFRFMGHDYHIKGDSDSEEQYEDDPPEKIL